MSAAANVVEPVSSTSRPALWSAVSSRDAAAVAARWTERRWVPFGVVVEREGAAEDREAVRFKVAEEPGIYRGVRAWSSAETFLHGLRLYLEHYPEALRGPNRGDSIAVDLFMKIMTLTASQAHPSTGRGCRAYEEWVAARAGCGPKTVQRAYRFAERRLDVFRELRRARVLRWEKERLRVLQGKRMRDGSTCRQRGVTPLRTFHVPAWLAPWIAMAAAGKARQRPVTGAGGPVGAPVGLGSGAALNAAAGASGGALAVDCVPLPVRTRRDEDRHLEDWETCGQGTVSLRSTKQPRSARRHDEGGRPRRRRRPIRGEELARGIAALLGWSTTRYQDGPRLSPRMTAPALAPFEGAGWTPEHWLSTARAVAVSLGYRWPTSSQQIASPGGWVRWLTQHMVPDEPPADVGADPAAPTWLMACGQAGCDGHGWLTSEPDPATGRISSRKCMSCPPRIREATPVQIERRDVALSDYEPPATVCVACRRPGPTVRARLDSALGSAACDSCWDLATSGPGSDA